MGSCRDFPGMNLKTCPDEITSPGNDLLQHFGLYLVQTALESEQSKVSGYSKYIFIYNSSFIQLCAGINCTMWMLARLHNVDVSLNSTLGCECEKLIPFETISHILVDLSPKEFEVQHHKTTPKITSIINTFGFSADAPGVLLRLTRNRVRYNFYYCTL